MRPSIVVASNPFGYGPTGKAHSIIMELRKRLPDAHIVFLGSKLCREIMSMNNIDIINIDERNEDELEKFLKNLDNPFIISSQNRFIIKVAKKLKLRCAFLDGLAWFWKSIPDEHMQADIIFWLNYPGIENKLIVGKNINLVPLITHRPIQNYSYESNFTLIHIGGCENPLTKKLPLNYLTLLAKSLNNLNHSDKIIIAGGLKAINFIKKIITNKTIEAVSYNHEQFLNKLAAAKHFITTAGQTATMEAFSLDIPTSFLLPSNLSQMALVDYLTQYNASGSSMLWEEYISVSKNLRQFSEKEALILIDEYAKCILDDEKLSTKFQKNLFKLINNIPNNSTQKKFLDRIGTSGAQSIVDILIDSWSLSPQATHNRQETI